jgi:hypothetical protein
MKTVTGGSGTTVVTLDTDKIGSVFRFVPDVTVDMKFDDYVPLKIVGGIFDMTDLTAAHGNDTQTPPGKPTRLVNYGLSWFDINQCSPDIDVFFDAGYRVPNTPGPINGGVLDDTDSGQCYTDSGINDHGCYGAKYRVRGGSSRDALIYLSGDLQSVVLGTNPFTTTGSPPKTLVAVTATAHGLHDGQFVSFNQVGGGTTFDGVKINGPYQVDSIINPNAFRITSSTPATAGAITGGGSGIVMTPQIFDETAQIEGAHASISGWAYRCAGFVSSKRQFCDLWVENARLFECENGIFGGNVGAPASIGSQGHRFLVRNLKAKRMQGRTLAFYGSRDVFLEDIVVEDFGGHVADLGLTQTETSDRIGAIELQSCTQARIRNVKVRQTENDRNLGVPPRPNTTVSPAGIVLGKSDDYTWATDLTHVQDLVCVDVNRDIVEGAGCDMNVFEDVRTPKPAVGSGIVLNASSLSGANSVITRFPMLAKRAWTPILHGSTGDATAYNTREGSYHIVGNTLFFDAYIDLSALTGLGGSVTITGQGTAPVNASTAISCAVVPFAIQLTAGNTSIHAQVVAGTNVISLWQYNPVSGALSALTLANFTATSRLTVSGSYKINILDPAVWPV